MNILCEGEVVSVWDGTTFIECTVISFYSYKDNKLVSLRGIGNNRSYVRLVSLFNKPYKKVPELSKPEGNQ